MKKFNLILISLALLISQLAFSKTGDYREETFRNRIKIRFSNTTTAEEVELVKASLRQLRPLQSVGVSDFIIFVGHSRELSSSTLMFSDEEISANSAVKGIMIDLTRVEASDEKEEYILQTFKQSLEHSNFLRM